MRVESGGAPVADAIVVPISGARYRDGRGAVRAHSGKASLKVSAQEHRPDDDAFAVYAPGKPPAVVAGGLDFHTHKAGLFSSADTAATVTVDLATSSNVRAKLTCGPKACSMTVPFVTERCMLAVLDVAADASDAVVTLGDTISPTDDGTHHTTMELELPPDTHAGWKRFALATCTARAIVGEP